MGVTPKITHMSNMEYKSGSSDKVYQLWIENVGANHTVKFRYGRRGSTLNSGTKIGLTHAAAAKDVYDKVRAEKLGKGYKDVVSTTMPKRLPLVPLKGGSVVGITAEPGGGAPAPKTTVTLGSFTALQLLNSIDEAQMLRLMKDDKWVFQQKHDGRRLVIAHEKGEIRGYNRKGQVVDCPEEYCIALQKFGGYTFILDGEACGDKYYVFDILNLMGIDQTKLPLEERLTNLGMLMRSVEQDVIQMVYTAESFKAKDSLFKAIKEGNLEGVAIKDRTSPYTAGRPHSGGPALKYKLVESVSCVVTKINDKRSVQVAVAHNPSALKALTYVGNVTVPINHEIPKVGDIVEVEYLYAYKGGSLYQPVYKGRRDDVPVDTLRDLKYKPTTKEE